MPAAPRSWSGPFVALSALVSTPSALAARQTVAAPVPLADVGLAGSTPVVIGQRVIDAKHTRPVVYGVGPARLAEIKALRPAYPLVKATTSIVPAGSLLLDNQPMSCVESDNDQSCGWAPTTYARCL